MITQTVTSRTDDRILGSTRVVAALIIPFLVAAFVILYLLPDATDRLFAWTIMPRMSALLMGAGYASGVYFFTRVLRAPRWHWIGRAFLPLTLFVSWLELVDNPALGSLPSWPHRVRCVDGNLHAHAACAAGAVAAQSRGRPWDT